jgi:hypothetical protein
MDYESVTNQLREMKSRFDDGFSTLDRSFLDSLYFTLFGREITNKGCSDCYRDAYIEITTKLNRDKQMPEKSDFQLKPGAVITFFGSSVAYTNANLTNEVAIRYLTMNRDNSKMFSYLPSNWEELIGSAQTEETAPAEETNEKDDKIAELEARVAELEAEKTDLDAKVSSLTSELAGANSSLETALAENDALKAEVAAAKKKSTKKSTKESTTATAETAPTVTEEQALDLES